MNVVTDASVLDSWRVVRLGDVCSTTSGGTPSRKNEGYFKGDIPWVKSGELPDGTVYEIEEFITQDAVDNSSAKVFSAGTLLIALYGATVGKLGILARDAATNQAVCAIFPNDEVDQRYLFWFLRFARSQLLSQAIGGAQTNISQAILRNLRIPIAPKAQQHRIVAEIEKQFSRLDEAAASLKRVKANLKRYKAAVLKAAVEGKLTEKWRKQNPDIEPARKLLERILTERRAKWEESELAKMKAKGKGPKDDKWKEKYREPSQPVFPNVQHVPSGWKAVSLESVSSALGGYAFKSKLFTETGPQIVKMANIKMGKLDLDARPSFIRDVQEDIVSKYKLADGDILVTLTGTRKKRDYGYVVQVRNSKNILLLNQRIARLRPYLVELSDYLAISLEGEGFRDRFFAHETGNVGQGNVGMNAVTTEYFLLPPMAEQNAIVYEWQQMESMVLELLAIADRQLRRAQSLKSSILAESFSGGHQDGDRIN